MLRTRYGLVAALAWTSACGGKASDGVGNGGVHVGGSPASIMGGSTGSGGASGASMSAGGTSSGGASSGSQGAEAIDGIVALTGSQATAALNAPCGAQRYESRVCVMTPPQFVDGPILDPTRLVVLYLVNGTGSDVGQIVYAGPDCNQGDGWRFDGEGSIELCANTCFVLSLDVRPTIVVIVKCG